MTRSLTLRRESLTELTAGDLTLVAGGIRELSYFANSICGASCLTGATCLTCVC
jgi:hypothetical protein